MSDADASCCSGSSGNDPSPEIRPLRYRRRPPPICRYHQVLMREYARSGKRRYYKCPVPRCTEKQKLVQYYLLVDRETGEHSEEQ